jgi:hypothetical protein
MRDETNRMIDSITIPVYAAARTDRPIPERVVICCPPSGSIVGVNFTVLGTFDPPDTQVVSCTIGGQQADQIFNGIDTWSANFTNVPVGNNQTLTATGDQHGVDAHININVVAGAADVACSCVSTDTNPGGDGTRPMFRALMFRGRFPVGSDGKPKALTLSFGGPACFTLGGPVSSPNRVLRCGMGTMSATEISHQENRWSATFNNVTPGTHTFSVAADDGTVESHPVVIQTIRQKSADSPAGKKVGVQ